MSHVKKTPGQRFREALEEEKPLQIVGTVNAYAAMMAERVGFRALYLSGAGVANISYGLPDLGITTLDNVLTDARRILEATTLPLLVDIDTGWGGPLMIARSIQAMETAGVAAVHIEDQVEAKRCGHRPGKAIVDKEEMIARLHAATDARQNPDFVIMARTDAYAIEGLEGMINRCLAYCEAGADMLFLEALPTLEDYKKCRQHLHCPLLANITEFGKTPLFTLTELASAGMNMALYPLSASRAMNLAALKVYQTLRQEGTQKFITDQMQTREELYGFLNYEAFEAQSDRAIQLQQKCTYTAKKH
jgi:methylisocitrate lyase